MTSSDSSREMKFFEKDLVHLIEKIKFRSAKNKFQAHLSNNLKEMHSSHNILIFPNKIINTYMFTTETYRKLLTNNVTYNYNIDRDERIENINHEFKVISSNLSFGDKIEPMAERDVFFSLKDHKDFFQN